MANRLHRFLESKGVINSAQVGFRRGCSTTDHIAHLDSDIKTSFNKKGSTVATFLDITKAFDTVWIQGLLFKMARIGISGPLLGWIKVFLTGRNVTVTNGSVISQSTPVQNGELQGAALSPILFNIMLTDFPATTPEATILLYTDDILLYCNTQHPKVPEVILQPALGRVKRWGRK